MSFRYRIPFGYMSKWSRGRDRWEATVFALRSTRFDLVLSALFIVGMGACGDLGGCGACGSQPLPGGRLPADQTIEGGAQIRVTRQGFTKLTSILPGLLNDQLAAGFCLPEGSVGSPNGFLGTGASYCTSNANGCDGCKVNVALNNLTPTVTNQNTLNLQVSTSINTTVAISGQVVGIGFSCNLGVASNNLGGNVDIAFGIAPDTGELQIRLARINNFTFGLNLSGCGPLSDIGNFASSFLDSFIGQFIVQLLTPTFNDIIQGFLPSPLGIAGMIDAGSLVAGISPGTEGQMEARIVPGGYVNLVRNGMSLGVITGLNADFDPSTRTPELDNQPALCVPPLPQPDFAASPSVLPRTSRNTFTLGVANEFTGLPADPNSDVVMGISETTLDLAGHHAVTSGLMCLGVGSTYIAQLNTGTIALLVPSLGELLSEQGNNPLLLVTRPQRALDFEIGDNTPASPALTIGVQHLEVDFYTFLYERYVRAFTLELTLDIGVNLEVEQLPGMPATLKPTLVGLSSENVTVKALNTEFVRETPAELEARLPSVFDLVTPLLGNLPAITVPSFAGFSLEDLQIRHITTGQDDFLGIYARLGASAMMRELASRDPFAAEAVAALDAPALRPVAPSTGTARLLRIETPDPAVVRASLDARSGAMPQVVLAVDSVDAAGRPLEWRYNLDGGMWHQYATPNAGQLVIAAPAFAWQGTYQLGLQSRVANVPSPGRTVSAVSQLDIVIDSAPPLILVDKLVATADRIEIPLWDVVGEHAVAYAFGKPGTDETTAWTQGSMATLSRTAAAPLLVDGELVVYARDARGNTAVVLVAPFHGQASEQGCSCDASGAPSPGGLVLAGLVGLLIFGRFGSRRSRRATARRLFGIARWASLATAVSLFPGCSCGNNAGAACETVEDCGPCEPGQLAYCIQNMCVCDADIPPGRIGPYSDIGRGGDGSIWVSAYAESHGDLVVAKVTAGRVENTAWEWVDGIPDVFPSKPDSDFRNGVTEPGEDVGMYTSIAVSPAGVPMVTYFDRDTASLRFAQKVGDTWQKHVIAAGTTQLSELGGELVGMYSSITLRTDDGRPGVAYLAHVADGNGALRAEVRYAAAQTATPTSAADWQFWVVDTAPLVIDPVDVYPLPQGLGLFIDSARLPDQAPVVAYYDRSNGDLKLATFDVTTGQFGTPRILDGSDGVDAGWSPTVAVDPQGLAHVAYVGATGDDLKIISAAPGAVSTLVDDGYRVNGTTVDNLPKPEFHFVGDDATLVFAGNTPIIVYQDATTQELLLATRQPDGTWLRDTVAGGTVDVPGAYGFFAASAVGPSEIVMSTWVIDQPNTDQWVEVFSRNTAVQ